MIKNTEMLLAEAKNPILEAIHMIMSAFELNLRSVYVVGSLAANEYIIGWSDIDLDIIVYSSSDEWAELQSKTRQLQESIRKHTATLFSIKSFPTWYVNTLSSEFKYGNLNHALMLLDNSIHVFGEDVLPEIVRPPRRYLQQEAVGVLHRLLAQPDSWWASRETNYLAGLIALSAKFIYLSREGRLASKSEAIESLLALYEDKMPSKLWPWIIWSLSCRSVLRARSLPERNKNSARIAAQELAAFSLSLIESFSIDVSV